jgi:predicted Zn-dependent protease
MSNLLCSPGEASEEGMIDRLGNGLRLHALSYGFSFGSTVEARMLLAEIIRNGKATGRYLTGGRILETRDLFCRAVELGRHSQFSPNALCGKRGQMLCDVGTQVPAVRLRSLRIAA